MEQLGAHAALVKGGHIDGDVVRDVLLTREGYRVFESPRIATRATHGTGCTLASAIAATWRKAWRSSPRWRRRGPI
ncbi:MAG: bifunctional hydroxymethylpyrimidine kinase/phosphomethylpyrimidine kinase [Hyphomonadaceae bacterium]